MNIDRKDKTIDAIKKAFLNNNRETHPVCSSDWSDEMCDELIHELVSFPKENILLLLPQILIYLHRNCEAKEFSSMIEAMVDFLNLDIKYEDNMAEIMRKIDEDACNNFSFACREILQIKKNALDKLTKDQSTAILSWLNDCKCLLKANKLNLFHKDVLDTAIDYWSHYKGSNS
jgi:hypothetical protein